VALLGRPNVGKSTLLNSLIGQKVSITTPKAQTTRHNIVGIHSLPNVQILYVDTPGIHNRGRSALNRYLNRAASTALNFVDVVVFLVEAVRWTDEDEAVLMRLGKFDGPVILAVNKIDRLSDKRRLLPFLDSLGQRHRFAEILPLSATKRDGLERLETLLAAHLPRRPFEFPREQVTTVSQRFLAAEVLREKLSILLQAELPYSLTVEIEEFLESSELIRIAAVVWVERRTQKGIVIGKGGLRLREAGRQARLALERQLDTRVHLDIWVRVRDGWADDERALNSLGYSDS
jgi:GTP-binding protein Era